MKKTIALIFCLIVLATPLLASAANPCTLQGAATSGGADPAQLPRCVNQIYVWSLGVAALLALLMMIVGGYYYMTSAGNAEQATKGVDMLWSSIIGLALLFGAYLLLNTINPDLVKFDAFSNDIKGLIQTPQDIRK